METKIIGDENIVTQTSSEVEDLPEKTEAKRTQNLQVPVKQKVIYDIKQRTVTNYVDEREQR